MRGLMLSPAAGHRSRRRDMAQLAAMLRGQAAILDGDGDHGMASALRSRALGIERAAVADAERRHDTLTLSRIHAHA